MNKTATQREVLTITSDTQTKTANVKTASAVAHKNESGLANLMDLIPDVPFTALEKVALQTKTPATLIASLKHAQQYLKPYEVQAIACIQQGDVKLAKHLLSNRQFIEADIKGLPAIKEAAPIPLSKLRDLKNVKQAMINKIAEGEVIPSMGVSAAVLAGDHGGLSQMTALANLAALAGSVMGMNVSAWIPLLLSGANVTNVANSLVNQASVPPVADILPQRDLMLAPLIYAKEASAMTTKERYTLPIITAMKEQGGKISWEKTASDILSEGMLRLKAKKIIKDSSYT